MRAGAFQSGNYGPPDGFCWDISCADQPMQDDPDLEDYNVRRACSASALQYACLDRTRVVSMRMRVWRHCAGLSRARPGAQVPARVQDFVDACKCVCVDRVRLLYMPPPLRTVIVLCRGREAHSQPTNHIMLKARVIIFVQPRERGARDG